MKKAILFLIIVLTFTSCFKSNEKSKIVVADWLLGKWENNSANGNLVEIWEKANDSLFNGKSFFIKEKDTLHSEQIKLEQKGEDLFYISTIKGQNNDEPVTFKHNIEIDKQLVFENPKNDYPQKISYSAIANDSLTIHISGVQQGKVSSAQYSLKKVK